MTPKQFIKYTKWLDKNNYAICDGVTTNMDLTYTIINILFAIGGIWLAMFLVKIIAFKKKDGK